MASKRFLGLGFTFAAQDKGLEKKLKSINSLFGEISRTTTLISRKSGKLFGLASEMQKGASSGGGAFVGSAGGRRGTGKAKVQTDGQRPGGLGYRQAADHPRIAKASDNQKILNDLAASLAHALEGYGPAFEKDARRIIDKAVKTGRSVGAVVSDMTNNAEKMAESASVLGNNFKLIKMGFTYIKEWVTDIGHSVNNFLNTLGVNLHEMIPKEFLAAGAVFQSMIRPLGDLGKSVVGMFTKKEDAKVQDRLTGKVGKITSALGDSKSMPTIQKLLAMQLGVLDNEKKDSGGGIMDKLKGLLADIPLIGPLLAGAVGMFAKALGGVVKAVESGPGIFSTLWSGIKGVAGYLMAFAGYIWDVIKVVRMFLQSGTVIETLQGLLIAGWNALIEVVAVAVEGLFSFAGYIAEFAIPVIALAGALFGFVTEIWKWKDTIIETFSVVGNLVAAVFGYAATWVQTAFAPLVNVVSSFITPIFQVLGKAIMALFDVFKGFGTNIAKVVGMSFDIFNNYAKSATTNLNTATKEMKNPLPPSSQPTLADVGNTAKGASDRIDNMRATSDMMASQAANNKLSQDQLDAQTQTNELLQQLVDSKGNAPGGKFSVDVKTDSKMISAKVRNDEISNASASGSSQ